MSDGTIEKERDNELISGAERQPRDRLRVGVALMRRAINPGTTSEPTFRQWLAGSKVSCNPQWV